MLRKLLILFVLCISIVEAKLPELTPADVKTKTEEILKSHATHKALTPEICKRILTNFIEELDPLKTYFLYEDVEIWINPTDNLLKRIQEGLKQGDFIEFKKIHSKMIEAIERRNELERKIEACEPPQNVDVKDVTEEKWTVTTEELISKLLKLKAMIIETADKLPDESKEEILQLTKKRRLNNETEILNTFSNDNDILVNTYLLKSIATALDSHTNYFTPSEASQFMIQVQQRLFGIGVQLKDSLHGLQIMRIIEGGPSDKNGKIKINDRIIAVNNQPIIGMDMAEAVEYIRGEKGTKVQLTILRNTQDNTTEKVNIEIVRDEVVLEDSRIESSYEPYGEGVIAHIRLYSFYQDNNTSSAQDIKKALDKLKNEHKIKGIVLDLRGNTGGLLPQAVAVSGLFITKGVIVGIKDNTNHLQYLRNTDGKTIWDGPLVVLVNKASASASEIVAQALQDYGRAIVVGDHHTYGKGSFQTFTLDPTPNAKVNPKGEYKITRGKYYTVSGKSPQLVGVKSDIAVPGILSDIEIGEKFTKYPLENDQIDPNFDDNLSDIPQMHRKKLSLIYKNNIQTIISTYTQYLETLNNNAKKRILNNKNYQNFLEELKKKHYESASIELFGQSDLQLVETFNIIKDLIYLTSMDDKHFD